MDFSDPMFLANAMIFHDILSHQMNNTIPSTFTPNPNFYSSPVYQGPRFDRYGVYYDGVANEYAFPTPIEDSINNPMTFEDIHTQKIYMKMVMGRWEDILLVSIFLNSPKIEQIPMIKMFIKERIEEFKEENDEVVIVVSGKRDKKFDERFLEHLKYSYKILDNKIVINCPK